MTPREPQDTVALDKAHLWHPFTQHRDWNAPEHEPLVLVSGQGRGPARQRGPGIHRRQLLHLDEPARGIGIRRSMPPFAPNSTKSAYFLSRVHPSAGRGIGAGTRRPVAREYADARLLFRRRFHGDGSGAEDGGAVLAADGASGADTFRGVYGRLSRRHDGCVEPRGHRDIPRAFSRRGNSRRNTWRRSRNSAVSIRQRSRQSSSSRSFKVRRGMRLWPAGMLAELRRWCDAHGILLILDEVMTGFGRTGRMFACEHEQVVPDFIALAKGLTGGYLPLAATLTTERVFPRLPRRAGAPRSTTGTAIRPANSVAPPRSRQPRHFPATSMFSTTSLSKSNSSPICWRNSRRQTARRRGAPVRLHRRHRTPPHGTRAVCARPGSGHPGVPGRAPARPAHAPHPRHDRAHAALLHHRSPNFTPPSAPCRRPSGKCAALSPARLPWLPWLPFFVFFPSIWRPPNSPFTKSNDPTKIPPYENRRPPPLFALVAGPAHTFRPGEDQNRSGRIQIR